MDIPLTFQESIAENIANDRVGSEMETSQDHFIIRKRKLQKLSMKNLQKLAVPKQGENTPSRC